MFPRWKYMRANARWEIILAAGMTLVMAIPLWAAAGGEEGEGGSEKALIAPEDASTISDFTLENLDGDDVTCDEILEQGVIFLDFWALWCRPCLKELGFLDGFVEKYGERGFAVLTINVDTPDSRDRVESYIQSHGYKFEVLLDPDKDVYYDLNVPAIPYSALIDPEGRIRSVHIGFQLGDEKSLEEEIVALLEEVAPETGEEPCDEEE